MSDVLGKAAIRAKGQLTLPPKVREALHAVVGDDVEFHVVEGTVVLRAVRTIAADQAWFWTPEWQAGEREASEQIARGEGEKFDSTADFLKALGQ
jgi:bifunctional DNA-binding transcriptional regulator/antitoxin component of YhaV-PrlF toxin-antitoxin module